MSAAGCYPEGVPLNPFTWENAIADGVSRAPFTEEVARILKGGTHTALFGPRGTGKTSFTLELRSELAKEHEEDAPSWEMIRVDLRRVISLAAFIGAVSGALSSHPEKQIRRRAKTGISNLEKTMKLNLGVVQAGVRTTGKQAANEAEVLHQQLEILPTLSDRIVVVFDEFQRLNRCPGDPLSIIRSALLAPELAGKVSLLLTGSLRERMELMLHTDTEPIWDQTHDIELPALDSSEFLDYLEHRFAATRRPIEERPLEALFDLADGHPKRTQHLAWQTWQDAQEDRVIDADAVNQAFETLLSSNSHSTNFSSIINTMLDGEESDLNNARALFLIGAGESPTSRSAPPKYGLSGATTAKRALERLRERGIVSGDGPTWRVVDPFFAEWLRRQDPVSALTRT